MKIEELKNGTLKLIADEGKKLISKATRFDEELGQDVPEVEGKMIYLGKNDSTQNYIEEEKEYGSIDV